MKVGILYPIYIQNRKHEDLAIEAIRSAKSKYPMVKLGIINKYYELDFDHWKRKQSAIDRLQNSELKKQLNEVLLNKENCVSSAWNIGFEYLQNKECDLTIFSNTDVILEQDAIDQFVENFKRINNEVIMISGNRTNHKNSLIFKDGAHELSYLNMYDQYSLFAVKSDFQNVLGKFDENFKPAYHEDVDLQYRIELAGKKHLVIENIKYKHYSSSILLMHENQKWAWENLSTVKSEKYMLRKWGGTRNDIKFKHPYNFIDKDHKYIYYPSKIKAASQVVINKIFYGCKILKKWIKFILSFPCFLSNKNVYF